MKANLDIRNEEILLLGLCRLEFSAEHRIMLQSLAGEITDWEYFMSLANAHGIAALAYHNLDALRFLQYIPPKTAGQLRESLFMNITRNVRNIEALTRVLNLLNGTGIKTILLKGIALEMSVYGNIGLRQMTDVDILQTRDDCKKTRAILLDNGFVSQPVKSLFHKAILADTGKHFPSLFKNGFQIDLHHEVFGAGNSDLTRMLSGNCAEIRIKGEKALIPHARLFFLYLVRHLYLHEMNNESQLRLYTDLVVLIEKHRDEILHVDLVEKAVQAGMAGILAWHLQPLRDLFGISFPEWMNDFINKWFDPSSTNMFIFFLKSPKGNPVTDRGAVYRYNVSQVPGIHRKILFVAGDLFPTLKFMKRRYNCKTSLKAIIYYPMRFGKLLFLFRRPVRPRSPRV
jgi:hypothetical protein